MKEIEVKAITREQKKCGFLWSKKKEVRVALLKNVSGKDLSVYKETYNDCFNGIDIDMWTVRKTWHFPKNLSILIALQENHYLDVGDDISFDFLINNGYCKHFSYTMNEE